MFLYLSNLTKKAKILVLSQICVEYPLKAIVVSNENSQISSKLLIISSLQPISRQRNSLN